jgi:hypothetical protein
MATPKQAHALVTYFSQQYEKKYGIKPSVNRYAARWGFDSILMDTDTVGAKALIDYYFETISTNGHSLEWFFYNYEKLETAKRKRDEDAAARAVLREQSRVRTEEWRKRLSGND